jgi:large subunit ribosomal protein L24
MKLRKNDNVMILAGKDRGKTGIIERVYPKEDRMIVKGIAMAKKCIKPSKKSPQGGIIDINLKVYASKAMIVCPACSKPTKITYKITGDKKMRICKKCGQSLESIVK